MRIVPIHREGTELGTFIDLPWKIYADQHQWVPPVKASVAADLSDSHTFFKHGEMQLFLCVDENGDALGRIAAAIDQRLLDTEIGHFGFFECIDHPHVAQKLMDAAAQWLRARGKTWIHGPIDFSIFHTYRIQVLGFEHKPFMGEPRSPRYYTRLMDAAGMQEHARWRSWDMEGESFHRFVTKVEKAAQPFLHLLHTYDMADWDLENFAAACRGAYDITMETFAKNYGFSPIAYEEYDRVFGSTHCWLKGGISREVRTDKEGTVAFSFGFHDVSDAMIRANGDHENLSWDNIDSDTAVFHSFGIKEAHRRSGLPFILFNIAVRAVHQSGINKAVGALAKEGRTIYDILGDATRAYAVFKRPL